HSLHCLSGWQYLTSSGPLCSSQRPPWPKSQESSSPVQAAERLTQTSAAAYLAIDAIVPAAVLARSIPRLDVVGSLFLRGRQQTEKTQDAGYGARGTGDGRWRDAMAGVPWPVPRA